MIRKQGLPVNTAKKERAVELYRLGATMKEIGDALGVGGTSVWRWLDAAGIKRRPTGRRPAGEAKSGNSVAVMYGGGIKIREISRLVDRPVERDVRKRAIVVALEAGQAKPEIAAQQRVGIQTVRIIARKLGIKDDRRLKRNQEILAALAAGQTYSAIAGRYGVTREAIGDFARRHGMRRRQQRKRK